MAKLGRNDRCDCGSGKKYKQCCLDAPVSAPAPGGASAAWIQERVKAEALVRHWMGEQASLTSPSPLRDRSGRNLQLVMDRFTVSGSETIAQVQLLGRSEGDRVLFFDAADWIGEADFSQPGEMTLVTPARELSDRLVALLQPISGLSRQQRQVDDLGALTSGTPGGGEGLLGFKTNFFQTWLDEPNQKLEQKTPRQAADSPALRPRLLQLIAELEKKEAKLPAAERFDFARLRSKLGL